MTDEKFKKAVLDEFARLRKLSEKEQEELLVEYINEVNKIPLGKSFFARELIRIKNIRSKLGL